MSCFQSLLIPPKRLPLSPSSTTHQSLPIDPIVLREYLLGLVHQLRSVLPVSQAGALEAIGEHLVDADGVVDVWKTRWGMQKCSQVSEVRSPDHPKTCMVSDVYLQCYHVPGRGSITKYSHAVATNPPRKVRYNAATPGGRSASPTGVYNGL